MTSEEKQTQELNSFRNIPDSFKKIVTVNGTKKPWRNEMICSDYTITPDTQPIQNHMIKRK